MSTVYGVQRTRVTLYNSTGVATQRITLQKEDREGLLLEFKAEGAATKLGSGSGWATQWTHHGFRPALSITWSAGLDSSVETWSGSAWGSPWTIATASALTTILNASSLAPCLVEPHLDCSYSFLAQPDASKTYSLRDTRGALHTDLSLDLVGVTLAALPDWDS